MTDNENNIRNYPSTSTSIQSGPFSGSTSGFAAGDAWRKYVTFSGLIFFSLFTNVFNFRRHRFLRTTHLLFIILLLLFIILYVISLFSNIIK